MSGGSAAFNPNTLPNQVAIWDFSAVANVSTSSGNLDGATDLSGNGNNVTLSANKPAYFSSGGQNGKGYIDMGASGDFVKTGISGVTTSPFTFYMVIQLPAVYTENSVVAEWSAGLSAFLVRAVQNVFELDQFPLALIIDSQCGQNFIGVRSGSQSGQNSMDHK